MRNNQRMVVAFLVNGRPTECAKPEIGNRRVAAEPQEPMANSAPSLELNRQVLEQKTRDIPCHAFLDIADFVYVFDRQGLLFLTSTRR